MLNKQKFQAVKETEAMKSLCKLVLAHSSAINKFNRLVIKKIVKLKKGEKTSYIRQTGIENK